MEEICELCECPIYDDELACVYDGERVHASCAAEDMDEAGFYDERDND